MEPEEQIIAQIAATADDDLHTINLPQSTEFVQLNDQQRLHVRTFWPSSDETPLKGVVLYLHGYNSHINRPANRHIAEAITQQGYAVVGFDQLGHGYSTGQRAYLEDMTSVVSHALSVIKCVYLTSAVSDTTQSPIKYSIDKKREIDVATTPLIVMGQSMGGALSVLVSKEVRDTCAEITVAGNILLCPAIGVKPIPVAMRLVMDYLIRPIIPTVPIPAFLSSSIPDTSSWSNAQYARYVKHDREGVGKAGLSSAESMCFGTAGTILNMSEASAALLPEIRYPLLLLHDQEDKVVSIDSSKLVLSTAGCEDSLKRLVEIPHGAHDLISNKTGLVSRTIAEWLASQSTATLPPAPL